MSCERELWIPCPPATFSHTNPLNISEIWAATSFIFRSHISMLQTSDLTVLLNFSCSFHFLYSQGPTGQVTWPPKVSFVFYCSMKLHFHKLMKFQHPRRVTPTIWKRKPCHEQTIDSRVSNTDYIFRLLSLRVQLTDFGAWFLHEKTTRGNYPGPRGFLSPRRECLKYRRTENWDNAQVQSDGTEDFRRQLKSSGPSRAWPRTSAWLPRDFRVTSLSVCVLNGWLLGVCCLFDMSRRRFLIYTQGITQRLSFGEHVWRSHGTTNETFQSSRVGLWWGRRCCICVAEQWNL